jgi:hypothetical protein
LKPSTPLIVLALFLLMMLIGQIRHRKVVFPEFKTFGAAAIIVYFLSRIFAFRLYVPNRHLQIPLALFFIVLFTVGYWRGLADAGSGDAEDEPRAFEKPFPAVLSFRQGWMSSAAMALLVGIVYLIGGAGFRVALNYNYSTDRFGMIFQWLKHHTPENALIAGHPTKLDAVQLFADRRGYATNETAHPFYNLYFKEIERRLVISLRAHYARNLEDVVRLVEPEGVTHFVFARELFYPPALESATFFAPLDKLVKELTSGPVDDYAYFQLPSRVDTKRYPFLVFRDERFAVVEIAALKRYLADHPRDSGAPGGTSAAS